MSDDDISQRPTTHTNHGDEDQPVEQYSQRFTSSGSKPENYDITSSMGEDDISNAMIRGDFGEKYRYDFSRLSDSQKKAIASKIKSIFDKKSSDFEKSRVYDFMTGDEFRQFGNANMKSLQAAFPDNYQDILDSFEQNYKGKGQVCFNFNKALRWGWDKFREWFNAGYSYGGQTYNDEHMDADNGVPGLTLSKQEFEDNMSKMDSLTSCYRMPKDVKTYRYVDENYLCSSFSYFMEKFPQKKDEFGYNTIDRNTPVKDIADALSDSIGCKVDSDSGFTSFSCVENESHMMKKQYKDDYKRVVIRYDIPQGTKCFVSKYENESEGVFPRGTKFFVKSVGIEPFENDKGEQLERVVMTIGIQRQ